MVRRGVSSVALATVLAAAAVAGAVAAPGGGKNSAELNRSARARPLVLREVCVRKAERRHVVRFRAIDGVRLIGLVLGHGPRGVILAHQGGAPPNLCGWLPYARALKAAGYRVLVFDHRGFGSSGSTSRRSRTNRVDFDVLGAVGTLRARGARSIVLGGASLGGAAVLGAAAHVVPSVDAVISFSSPHIYANVDAVAAVRAFRTPALFLADEHDAEFADEARMLYEACASPEKRLVVTDGADHGFRLLENPETRALVDDFIARHSQALETP
jgi:pimeloyl-ACP methyl ester carboxylesterase